MPAITPVNITEVSVRARELGIHEFEVAGLGRGPFRCVSYEKGSTHCQFCGTYIVNIFWVAGSDPSYPDFYVGCECIKRTHDSSSEIYSLVSRYMVDCRREASNALYDRVKEAKRLLGIQVIQESLATVPHPDRVCRERGDTALVWATWVMRNGGLPSKLKVADFLGC